MAIEDRKHLWIHNQVDSLVVFLSAWWDEQNQQSDLQSPCEKVPPSLPFPFKRSGWQIRSSDSIVSDSSISWVKPIPTPRISVATSFSEHISWAEPWRTSWSLGGLVTNWAAPEVEDYLFLVLGLRRVKELPELTHAHTSPSQARKD